MLNWTVNGTYIYATNNYFARVEERPDFSMKAGEERILIAKWGSRLLLYTDFHAFIVEYWDSDGGEDERRVIVFDDLAWATRFFAALHRELDDEAGTCALGDERCPHYRLPPPH